MLIYVADGPAVLCRLSRRRICRQPEHFIWYSELMAFRRSNGRSSRHPCRAFESELQKGLIEVGPMMYKLVLKSQDEKWYE